MEKEYKYDAFISYRHCELDKYVAENLHKVLETYELPKNVKEKLGITGRTIKRVFRDQDELPLSSNLEDPIIDALNNSKYLIVICSPRLKDSLWCKKEIETFKKIRGRKNIFCVLIEGEPEDSFPEEVLYDEIETTDKNGKKKITKKLVEPLAADVRGINKKEVLRKIKEEKLRLIAPMYNLDYDELKQRHKIRRMKRIIFMSTVISSICILFAIYSTFMFLKISSQQKILKKHQALSLSEKAIDYIGKDSRYKAVKTSYEALTKFNGVNMPYTANAEYALSESLGLYNAGFSYKAINELPTKGVVDFIKTSYNDKYLLSFDESEELILWDINKMKKIATYKDMNAIYTTIDSFTFIGNDKIAYITSKGNIKVANIKDGKVLKEIKKKDLGYKSIKGDFSGKYLVINDSPKVYLYDAESLEQKGEIKLSGSVFDEIYFSLDSKHIFVTTNKGSYDPFAADNITIHNISVSDFKEKDAITLESKYLIEVDEKDDILYILSNQSIGTKYDLYVTSYDYKNNKVNYSKAISNNWGSHMLSSFVEGSKLIAVSHGNVVNIINSTDGKIIQTYSLTGDVIELYASFTKDLFMAFTEDGNVHYISLDYNDSVIYNDLYEFNLDDYKYVANNETGYLLVAKNQNRIIYYERNKNKDIKEEKLDLDYLSDQGLSIKEVEKIKKDYDLKKKNLVRKIIYGDNKKYLFVSYTDNTVAIYNTKTKKYINMIKGVKEVNHYLGKDKYNRYYVGNTGETYILNKEFEKVGRVSYMNKLDTKNNRIIFKYGDKFYSSKIYSLDDLLSEAKKYLNK